jgi:predicted Zn-dependent protease
MIYSSILFQLNESQNYQKFIQIRFLKEINQLSPVQSILDNLIEANPNDPFWLTEKADLEFRQNKIPLAHVLLDKALTIYPNYCHANYLKGSILFNQFLQQPETEGKHFLELAKKYLQQASKSNANHFQSMSLLGVVLSELEEFAQSNYFLEQAFKLKPASEVLYYQAFNYEKLNEFQNEISTYKKILQLSPVFYNYKIFNRIAELYFQAKDFKNASIYLEEIHHKNPYDLNNYYNYLYSLFAQNRFDKFLGLAELEKIKHHPWFIYAKALILYHQHNYSKAEKLLKLIETTDFRAEILLIEIAIQRHEYLNAYQRLEKTDRINHNYLYYSLVFEICAKLKLNNRSIASFNLIKDNKELLKQFSTSDIFNILFAYSHCSSIHEALQTATIFDQLLEKPNPFLKKFLTHLHHYLNTGQIDLHSENSEIAVLFVINSLKRENKFTDAYKLLAQFIQLKKSEVLYSELAELLLKLKQTKKTEKLLKQLLKKYPNSTGVKNFYAYFLAIHDKKLSVAYALSKQTLQFDKENPAFLDTFGLILLKQGKTNSACNYLKKAYDKNPFEPEIIEHLADCYNKTGKIKLIHSIYEHARNAGENFEKTRYPNTDDQN